jgi:L-threonylcarbamoyladenylate synthase
MKTVIIRLDENLDQELQEATETIRQGGVVAFPTETVYGLACSMTNESGIHEIYRLKGRDFRNPLSAHISNLDQMKDLAIDLDDRFDKIAQAFLPGPLALIVKKNKSVSDFMTAGMNTIGIRFPDNEFALRLIDAVGEPLAGTSANLSGMASSVTASEVAKIFSGQIPYIIDGGTSKYSKESTIISLVNKEIKLLRTGAVNPYLIEAQCSFRIIK